jgi:hypothetical protein
MNASIISLFELTKEQLEIAQLVDQSEESDEIDQAMLQISKEQFVQKSANYLGIMSAFNGEIERFKVLKQQVDVAIKRKERVVEKLKQNLSDAVKLLGTQEVGIYKLSMRKNPGAVVIEDSSLLTDGYVTRKVVVAPDKAKIGADLKKGIVVPGASLLVSESLSIK